MENLVEKEREKLQQMIDIADNTRARESTTGTGCICTIATSALITT